jgi:hypothetical protein
MANPLIAGSANRSPIASRHECRVYERHPCHLETSCNPPAIWSSKDQHSRARIRDLSTSGLCLLLDRPFEPGTGLVIELPGVGDQPPSIVFARVVHARNRGMDWALGCAFASPITEKELDALLHVVYPVTTHSKQKTRTASPSVPPKKPAIPLVSDVYFRGVLGDGQVIERLLKRVELSSSWPLAAGAIVSLRLGGAPPGNPAGKVRVLSCCRRGDAWLLEGTFLDPPPTLSP